MYTLYILKPLLFYLPYFILIPLLYEKYIPAVVKEAQNVLTWTHTPFIHN